MSPEKSSVGPRWSVVELGPGEFQVGGEIDAYTAPLLADRVAASTGPMVVLDLGGVTFIDSSGLRVVLQLHRAGLDGGPELVITNPSRSVVRLFDIGGLSGLLQPGSP